MPQTIKAARFYGARDVRLEDIESPNYNDDKALVAGEWCGICGSDLAEYLNGPITIPTPSKGPHPLTGDVLPVTMGHEFCGRVIKAPSGSGIATGQPVVVDPRLFCGACNPCSGSATHLCEHLGFYGLSCKGGGLSEVVAVAPSSLHTLPGSVNLSVAALIEPLAVAWHAIKLSGIKNFQGIPVLVVGGGPIGLAVASTLHVFQADEIFVSEPLTKRAKAFDGLAEAVINPLEQDVETEMQGLTNGKGPKLVIECSGKQQAINVALASLQYHGICISVGIPGPEIVLAVLMEKMTLPFGLVLQKELILQASLAYDDQDFRETVTAFNSGHFKGLENMVSSRIPLSDVVEKGFEQLVTQGHEHMKILVSPRGIE